MKTDRHKKILELIDRYEIGTQEELAKILNDEGYNVTQATVSRDIRELNLSKVSVDGKRTRYATLTKDKPVASDKFLTVLKEGFVSMDMAQNILVIKTAPGMAMAVCAAIDALDIMCKTADVELASWERKLGGRLVTIIVEGDVSAVTEAVNAAATGAIKKPVSYAVIARPHEEIVRMVELSASRWKNNQGDE